MKPTLTLLLLLAGLLSTTRAQEATLRAQDRPARTAEVLILGTYHMENPGRDLINPPADDVLEAQRQAELQELVARLARFEPTHVAVEMTPGEQGRLEGWYRSFVEGSSKPSRSEIYQIAFPLAAQMNLERLQAIDSPQALAMNEVLDYARKHQPALSARFDHEIEQLRVQLADLMARPIPEILVAMNTPDPLREQGMYMLSAQVGTADAPLGAQMTADWHARNLRIYGNIARLATTGSERIVVLIGAGHAALLREFVAWSPNLRLADTLEYLRP